MGKLAGVVRALDKAKKARLTAYHGTPHEVDKFSMEKIGTGEGAQAYGHGLYFAENPEVGKQYADILGAGEMKGGEAAESKLLKRMEKAQDAGNYTEAQVLEELLVNRSPAAARQRFTESGGYSPQTVKDANKILDELEGEFSTSGNLYKVELDIDPDTEMLDWDAPLSEQPHIIESLNLSPNDKAYWDAEIRKKQIMADPEGAKYADEYDQLTETASELRKNLDNPDLNLMQTGEKFVRGLQKESGQADTDYMLNQMGIKGIRYDDGFSRGKEGGTKNFVVFDDSLITIAEKNGIPIEQVDELAQAQGIPKQQALAMLIGGTGGIALMGGPERAEAGIGSGFVKSARLLDDIREAAKKADLDPNQITVRSDGFIEYPEEYINPLSNVGAGDIRYQVARNNDAVLGTDTEAEYDLDNPMYHGTREDILEFDPKEGKGVSRDSLSSERGALKHAWGAYDKESIKNVAEPYASHGQVDKVADEMWARFDSAKTEKERNKIHREIKKYLKSPERELNLQGETLYPLVYKKGKQKVIKEGGAFAYGDNVNPNWEADRALKRNKSLVIHNFWDGPTGGAGGYGSHIVVKPENLRSPTAAFDPQFKDSSNLLGSVDPRLMKGMAAGSATAAAAPMLLGADKQSTTGGRAARARRKFIEKRARQGSPTALQKIQGLGELGLTIGSGMLNESAAGLMGMAASLDPTTSVTGADMVRQVQNDAPLQYIPASETGMEYVEGTGRVIEDVGQSYRQKARETGFDPVANFNQSADYLGENVSPAAGTALKVLPDTLF